MDKETKEFLDVMFENSSLIQGKCTCDEDKKLKYVKGIEFLKRNADMIAKLEIDDPEKHYYVHSADVIWKTDDGGTAELNTQFLTETLSYFDTLVINKNDETWMLASTIYEEIE